MKNNDVVYAKNNKTDHYKNISSKELKKQAKDLRISSFFFSFLSFLVIFGIGYYSYCFFNDVYFLNDELIVDTISSKEKVTSTKPEKEQVIIKTKAEEILGYKKVSILGDSISSLKNYIPSTNRAKYVENEDEATKGDIYITFEDTWWGSLIDEYNMALGINESWAGSTVSNTRDTNYKDFGPERAMASINRIKALGENGTPDIIFFFGGTNDIGKSVNLGSFDSSASYATTLDETSTKYNSFVEAYSITLMRLKYYYPDAKIIALLPLSTKTYYTEKLLKQYKDQMKKICDFHDIEYIDLGNAGINPSNIDDYLADDIHPNKEGMKLLKDYIVSTLNFEF